MLWRNCLTILVFSAAAATAALLPDEFAGAKRSGGSPAALPDSAVWQEYGHEENERASYGPATITAYRFRDTTGAFAALQWLNGDAAFTGVSALYKNYVLRYEGVKPSPEQVVQFGARLPRMRNSSLPALAGYLPEKNRVRATERYVLGPASLAKFAPQLPASLVGFEKGAEAEVAAFRLHGGVETMALVAYPTPQIAMERMKAFRAMSGAVLRRVGTMIAIVPAPVDTAAAQRLVSQVNYNPKLTWNEKAPEDPRKIGFMFLSISMLAGGLIVGSILLGVFFGGMRRFGARSGLAGMDPSFTSLNLEGRETPLSF